MILRPTEVLESRTDHEDTLLVSMKDRKAINAAGSDHASSQLCGDARDVMGEVRKGNREKRRPPV